MKKINSLVSIILASVILNLEPALAGKLTQWTYNLEQNQLEFTLEESTTPNYFILENPVRIVIDLPNTRLGNVKIKENYIGRVREIRLSQFSEEVTRLVVELVPEIKLNSEQITLAQVDKNRWILRQNVDNVTVSVPPLQPRDQPSANSPQTEEQENKSPIIKFGEPLP